MHALARVLRPDRRRFAAFTVAATLAAAAFSARPAAAGSCGGDELVLEAVQLLERFARRGGKPPELGEFCIGEAMADSALNRRVLKACDAIIARDPTYLDCMGWALSEGKRTVGGVDIYDALFPRYLPLDPFGTGRTGVSIAVTVGEPRALTPTREAWQAALSDPRASKKRFAHDWLVFRNNAIALFAKVGGAAERDFLAAQLPAAKDRAMKKRMQKAIAAIDKRLAAAKP